MAKRTLWQRFYRATGGRGPDDAPRLPLTWETPLDFPSSVACALIRAGFLMRDPEVLPPLDSWLINFRWQWRFWRGPYWAVARRDGRELGRWSLWRGRYI